MDDVIEYMGGYWMMRVGPARISVFQDVNRTNNGVESFNHTFSLECGGVRPNPWAFISMILFHCVFVLFSCGLCS